jgi:hypothetical protein
MKKFLCAFVLTIAVLGELSITAASSQTTPRNTNRDTTVDLTKVDCRSLLKMDGEDRDAMVMFLHGYMSGRNNETVIDAASLTEATSKIAEFCIDNPNASVMSAFQRHRTK